MSLVLDSSATLAWMLAEETTDAVNQAFDAITRDGAWAPAIWRLEVANGLQMAVRRGRISADDRDAFLADLRDFAIAADDETDRHAWSTTLRLAERFGLTLYDAAYLELAQRRRLPLATLDQDLRAAAGVLNVELLGIAD